MAVFFLENRPNMENICANYGFDGIKHAMGVISSVGGTSFTQMLV
jgi:hypothetical protein